MRSTPFQRVDSCTSMASPRLSASRMIVVSTVYFSVNRIESQKNRFATASW